MVLHHKSRATLSLSVSSDQMRNASPVFIVGGGRSGSSLLYLTLQRHPAFRPLTINLQETQIIRRLPTAFRFDEGRPRQLFNFMLRDRDRYNAFLVETKTLRRATLPTAPVSLALRGNLPSAAWRAHGLHLVVRSYFAHAWTARGSARLLEKSPGNVLHIGKLRLVSPGSRMLFICRHPVDVYSSFRKRARVDAKAAAWADLSLGRFTRRYRRAVSVALAEAAAPDSALLVTRYEDFTHEPKAEFRRICGFLGESFDEAALDGKEFRANHPEPYQHLYGAITPVTKKWEEYVSLEEARRIETSLQDVMQLAGYIRYT